MLLCAYEFRALLFFLLLLSSFSITDIYARANDEIAPQRVESNHLHCFSGNEHDIQA